MSERGVRWRERWERERDETRKEIEKGSGVERMDALGHEENGVAALTARRDSKTRGEGETSCEWHDRSMIDRLVD